MAVSVGNKVKKNATEKLLGIWTGSKLGFNHHINKMCDKASQMLNVLDRVSSFMSTGKNVNYESIN